MHITKLTLRNWMRYRGERTVELGPNIYSVTARLDSNEDRSNWLGKSSFMGAIPFALYGKHEKNTEDEWITNGEDEGEVRLVLSHGMVVSRARRRGKTTVLTVTDGKSVLTGKEAQEEVDRVVGFDAKDFFAAVFVRQKRLDAFVQSTSGQRMQMLRDWLDLERIEKAEDILAERLDAERKQEGEMVRSLTAARNRIEEILRKYFDFENFEDLNLDDACTEVHAMIAEAKDAEQSTMVRVAELRAKLSAADKAREREEAKAKWERYQAEMEAIGELPDLSALREQNIALNDKASEVKRRLDAASSLACGTFDGVCPIDGHRCSDADSMNAQRSFNAERRREIQEQYREVQAELKLLQDEIRDGERRKNAYASLSARADELMRQYELGRNVQVPSETPAELKEALSKIDAEHRQAIGNTITVARDCKDLQECVGVYRELCAELSKTSERAKLFGHAVRIVGRNGLQKVLCERARVAIESKANAMLSDAGIALRISLTWQREGKSYAKNCIDCGAIFPTKSAKRCSHCGAERTANVINELDVNLSDRSGAAEDLAGCAIQMAASQFLREQRGSAWATLCIDEPFGALDSQNRKDLARHLVGMVRGGMGFEQAFVIAHDRALMDALPARVEIRATLDRSNVEVKE